MPLLDLVPGSFGDYEAAGGGRGLQTAVAAGPVAVIGEVARSGLRGRGGAGFPTGEKWRAVRAVGAGPRFGVCNAAEGGPATFKDRLLLRTNPLPGPGGPGHRRLCRWRRTRLHRPEGELHDRAPGL